MRKGVTDGQRDRPSYTTAHLKREKDNVKKNEKSEKEEENRRNREPNYTDLFFVTEKDDGVSIGVFQLDDDLGVVFVVVI